MSYSKEELSEYRLSRAQESLEEAKLLGTAGYWNAAANRLYYACFYAVSAYLIVKEVSASTHAGVKSAFNRELIKSGLLPATFGLLFNKLFNLRQDADYRDYQDMTESELQPLIVEAGDMVDAIRSLIAGHA